MPQYTHGVEPIGVYIDDERVLRIYLGDELVYDDTGATVVNLRPAYAVGSAPAPTVGRGARIALPAAEAVGSAPTPELRHGARLDIGPAVSESAAPAPVAAAGATVALDPAVSHSTAPAISVGETVVDLGPAVATVAAPLIEVSAGATVALDAARSTSTAPAPAVRAGATVSLGPARSAGTAPVGEVLLAVEYSDNFDRANGALGANWATMGTWPPPVINGNKAQGGTTAPTSQGRAYAARYASALRGDTQEVEFIVVNPTGTAALNIGGGAFVRANSTGDRVDLIVTNNSVHLMTRIGSNTVDQAAATGLPTIAAGTAFKLRCVGNVYTGYRAGVQVVQWTDSSGLIAIGSGTRHAGVLCVEQKNQLGSPSWGWAIDNWVARG